MKQSNPNLVYGMITGCFIAVLVVALTDKVRADEIIHPPSEQSFHSFIQKNTDRGVFTGKRGSADNNTCLRLISQGTVVPGTCPIEFTYYLNDDGRPDVEFDNAL